MLRCSACKGQAQHLFDGKCTNCFHGKGGKKMKLSANFIELGREIKRKNDPKGPKKPICEFCLKEADEVHKSKADPLIGRVCAGCEKELLKAHPIQEVGIKKEKKPSDPNKYPVRNWIKKYIEENHGVTFNTISTLMLDKGNSESAIKTQIKRIQRDYEIDGKVILALKGEKK